VLSVLRSGWPPGDDPNWGGLMGGWILGCTVNMGWRGDAEEGDAEEGDD